VRCASRRTQGRASASEGGVCSRAGRSHGRASCCACVWREQPGLQTLLVGTSARVGVNVQQARAGAVAYRRWRIYTQWKGALGSTARRCWERGRSERANDAERCGANVAAKRMQQMREGTGNTEGTQLVVLWHQSSMHLKPTEEGQRWRMEGYEVRTRRRSRLEGWF